MKRADLPIALPCHEDWDTMTAEGRTRFCASCRKEVHDLSRLTELEARLLVAKTTSAAVCVRYLADRHGDVLLAMVPSGFVPVANLRVSKAERMAIGALALAVSVAATTACSSGTTGAAPQPVVPEHTMTMGELAPSDLPAPAPSATVTPPAPSATTPAPPK